MTDPGSERSTPDGAERATPGETTVLIVEDEPDVADLYRGALEGEGYPTETVHSIGDALSTVDERFDTVLLDRRLPDGEGREFLSAVRERGLDVRVAMVTAVVPDFDILEMGFDLYLLKPAGKEELLDAVETLTRRSQYDETLQRTASLASKRAVLEAEKPEEELDASEEYTELTDELDDLDEELSALTQEFENDDYRRMFQDIGGV
jgi:DNA-binding response OmpR family regulator